LATRSTAKIRLAMKGSILPWSSGTLSLFKGCIPSFTVAQGAHESLTIRSAHPRAFAGAGEGSRPPASTSERAQDAPMHRLGVMRGMTGPAGRDRPQRTRFGRRGGATGCATYADEILLKTHYDDLECHDLLRVGRAGYRYGFAALNLGLAADGRRGWKAP
jgi:hypothetical protein